MKHRWIGEVGPEPLPADELVVLARSVLPGVELSALRPLAGGFRNWTYRVEATPARVLRICAHGDRSAWKERAVTELVGPGVVAPRILDVQEVHGRVVVLREFVAGTVLHEPLLAGKTLDVEIGEAIGRTLARIHAVEFDAWGELDEHLKLGEPFDLSAAGWLRHVDEKLNDPLVRERVGDVLSASLPATLGGLSELLDGLDGCPVLVHGDFGPTNLVWNGATLTVLDWEFACSARPALDLGNLLRPPLDDDAFSQSVAAGYVTAGGRLPADWRRLAQLVDVTAWLEFASRASVPSRVLADVRERIESVVRSFA